MHVTAPKARKTPLWPKLKAYLKKFLKGEQLPEEEAFLGPEERLLLYGILAKKYRHLLKSKPSPDQSISNLVKARKE